MSEPLLRISGLDAFYGEAQALRGIDLSVAEGEVVTLVGRNGAGKTTLTKVLAGEGQAAAGSVTHLPIATVDDPLVAIEAARGAGRRVSCQIGIEPPLEPD